MGDASGVAKMINNLCSNFMVSYIVKSIALATST